MVEVSVFSGLSLLLFKSFSGANLWIPFRFYIHLKKKNGIQRGIYPIKTYLCKH